MRVRPWAEPADLNALNGPLACARTQGGACEGSSVAHVDVPGLKVTAFSVRSGGCAHSPCCHIMTHLMTV
jgi:hypothetical protein